MRQSNDDLGFAQSGRSFSHDALRERLPEYATTIILRHAVALKDTDQIIQDHLKVCVACQTELAELIELGGPLYRGEVEMLYDPPHFQLDFLRTGAAKAPVAQPSWWRDQLGRLFVQFSNELLSALRPRSQLMAARSEGMTLLRYQPQADPPGSFYLTIDILDQRDPETVALHVQIDLADRDALNQEQTIVRIEGRGQVWSDETNESGVAIFPDIPRQLLAELRVAIDPGAPE
jgi:hypothetical protein